MTAVETLSQRERQVLERLAAGQRFKEIAFELGISEDTVSEHVRRARSRLDANTTAQCVAIFARQVEPEPGRS